MFDEYDSNWKIYNALNDQPREDLIKTEIYAKAHLELRTLVDEVIKIELERLKMALARDLSKVNIIYIINMKELKSSGNTFENSIFFSRSIVCRLSACIECSKLLCTC